jgi:hypothetical protein
MSAYLTQQEDGLTKDSGVGAFHGVRNGSYNLLAWVSETIRQFGQNKNGLKAKGLIHSDQYFGENENWRKATIRYILA